jgi:hypothetical protein
MLTFCSVGVLPASRPYLNNSLSDAVDLTVTRKFLNKIQYQSALGYLYNQVIEPESAARPDLDKFCTILDRLDEQGLFTRVALRELRDFGAKARIRYPTGVHKEETAQFIKYMDVIIKRSPHEEVDTQFQGNHISMGFVFIGAPEKVEQEGCVPYFRAIQYKKGIQIEKVYLAARGDCNIDTAKRTAYLAEKRGIAKILKSPMLYYATDRDGSRRKNILIEMRTIVSAPFAPPEQGILLEE